MGFVEEDRGRDTIAIILAIGLATATNCITFAVLYDAIVSQESGLSENATQILTAVFGGIIGVLGSYLGYRVGARERDRSDDRATHASEPLERSEAPVVPPDAVRTPTGTTGANPGTVVDQTGPT